MLVPCDLVLSSSRACRHRSACQEIDERQVACGLQLEMESNSSSTDSTIKASSSRNEGNITSSNNCSSAAESDQQSERESERKLPDERRAAEHERQLEKKARKEYHAMCRLQKKSGAEKRFAAAAVQRQTTREKLLKVRRCVPALREQADEHDDEVLRQQTRWLHGWLQQKAAECSSHGRRVEANEIEAIWQADQQGRG